MSKIIRVYLPTCLKINETNLIKKKRKESRRDLSGRRKKLKMRRDKERGRTEKNRAKKL